MCGCDITIWHLMLTQMRNWWHAWNRIRDFCYHSCHFLCVAHWHNTRLYNINIFLTLYWIFKEQFSFPKPINICRVENYGPYLHIHCSKFWQWSIRCSIFSIFWNDRLKELVVLITFHLRVRYFLSECKFCSNLLFLEYNISQIMHTYYR